MQMPSDATAPPTAPALPVPERMPWIAASVLLSVPGYKWIAPELLAGKTVRQLAPGQLDQKGCDISEFFVLVDVGTVLLYPGGCLSNTRPWVMNRGNSTKASPRPSPTFPAAPRCVCSCLRVCSRLLVFACLLVFVCLLECLAAHTLS